MTTICKKGEPLEECEQKLLQRAIQESDEKQKNKLLTEEVLQIVDILKQFMVKKRVICYGGTAINNILPREARFYQENELPDFDFYSIHPLDDAKLLVNVYVKKGFREVEAKSGQHVGTFKVYVNFIPIADITYLDPPIFNSLAKEAIVIDGIRYAPPNYLRMSMFLELSRPSGDVSRWEKVFSRLFLLNSFYPLTTNSSKYIVTPHSSSNSIFDFIVTLDVLFFGGYAFSLLTKLDGSSKGYYDIISKNSHMTIKLIVTYLREEQNHIPVIRFYPSLGTIPPSIQIIVKGEIILTIYQAESCYSYNEHLLSTTIGEYQRIIKVATIDTILSFYLAFIFTPNYDRQQYLFMAITLFELEQQNRNVKSGMLKRFSTQCYGKEETIYDIRKQKANKKREFLKRGIKKTSKEYEWYFLNYSFDDINNRQTKKYGKRKLDHRHKLLQKYTKRNRNKFLF
jgi:hypothetical protein